MAINGGDVKFSFTGDSSDLNSALAKASKNLDGLTVAGQGAANKISKDLNKATTKASKQLDGFTESAGDADSVMMGLAGAIDLVNPALGDMVRVSGDVLAGTEAVGRAIKFSNPIFIALAAAAAALGGAYYLLKEDTEEADEAAERLAEQQLKVNLAMAKGKDALVAARNDLAALSGAFTEAELAMFNSTQAATGAYAPAIAKVSEEIEAATKEEERLLKVITDKGMTYADDKQRYLDAQAVTKGLREQRTQLGEEEEELAATLNATAEKKAKIAAQEEAEAEKEKKRDEAKRRRLKAEADALKEVADVTKETNDKKAQSDKEYADAHAAAAASIALDDAAEIANKRKTAEEAKKAYLDRIGYQGDFVSASGDLAEALTARLGASEKTQAMVAYAAAKSSAVSQILISGMVAAAKVTEQTGIGAILAVPAVAALTAVQLAAVLATPPPKFHSGGMIAPDERMITAQTGEAVLSRSGVAAAGGASGVNALNRGGAASGAIVVVNQYRHRVFDSFIMDNLRRTGSPLAAAISATGSKAGIA